jgi:tetratricopeptide (TPR) repeat protein
MPFLFLRLFALVAFLIKPSRSEIIHWPGLELQPISTCVQYGSLIDIFHDKFRRWFYSESKITTVRTYDQAEAFEKKNDFKNAIIYYEKIIAVDKSDMEARRRLAELLIKTGDRKRGVELMANVFSQITNPEKKIILGFKVSDMFIEDGDYEKARTLLRSFHSQLRDTQFGKYVQERLNKNLESGGI